MGHPDQAGDGVGGQAAPRRAPELIRLQAVLCAARFHGIDLDVRDFAAEEGEAAPSIPALARWVEENGGTARGMRLQWADLVRLRDVPPVVLMFADGSAGLMVGVDEAGGVVWLADPFASPDTPPVAVDALRLEAVWTGDVLLVRGQRDSTRPEPRSISRGCAASCWASAGCCVMWCCPPWSSACWPSSRRSSSCR